MNRVIVSTFPITFASTKPVFNSRIFKILAFLAFFSIIVFSILQSNDYANDRYLIRDYENRIKNLNYENRYLEINYSLSNSFNNLGNYVQNKTFEKTDNIEYIRVLNSTALAK